MLVLLLKITYQSDFIPARAVLVSKQIRTKGVLESLERALNLWMFLIRTKLHTLHQMPVHAVRTLFDCICWIL